VSVTATERTNSRNGGIIYFAPSGCDCGANVAMYQRVDASGEPADDAKPLGFHCLTCHGRWHNACLVCGACLPDWKPTGIPDWPWEERRRSDARYCSNACRQRAYRKRKAVA
jgi:hypothetical protein